MKIFSRNSSKFTLVGIFYFIIATCAPVLAFANESIGDVASNIVSGEINIRTILQDICIITGVSFILGSIVQYRKHRQNPSEVTLSTVIVTFIIGVLVLLMALIPIQFS
jgi:hypothetical protein